MRWGRGTQGTVPVFSLTLLCKKGEPLPAEVYSQMLHARYAYLRIRTTVVLF
jgi:hypothetical protein